MLFGPRAVFGLTLTLWRDRKELRGAEPRDVSFELDGVRHDAAIYGATAARPGVLLLHTAGGLTMHERALAARLARSGFTTMTVRYSGRTSGAVTRDEEACRRIDRVCMAAFDRLASDRAVLPGKLAVFGLSLGGHFALRLAASGTGARPARVVVWYGVYPSAVPLAQRLRAPLLIVQGERDNASFVQAARDAAGGTASRVELLSYAGLMHQFDVFQPLAQGTQAAWQRTVDFLTDRGGPWYGPEDRALLADAE